MAGETEQQAAPSPTRKSKSPPRVASSSPTTASPGSAGNQPTATTGPLDAVRGFPRDILAKRPR